MRYSVSLIIGAIMGILLFYLMHALIEFNQQPLAELPPPTVEPRVPMEIDEPPPERTTKPRDPAAGIEPGPIPDTTLAMVDPPERMDWETIVFAPIPIGRPDGVRIGGQLEHGLVAIVPIVPRYPHECRLRGVEGRLVVGFWVYADGTVGDVEILEHENRRCFEQEVRRALLRARFKPFMGDNDPVRRYATEEIVFTLIDEAD